MNISFKSTDHNLNDKTIIKFRGIWLRLLKTKTYGCVTNEQISLWAKEKGLSDVSTIEKQIGTFLTIKALILNTSEGRACFPRLLPTEFTDIENKKQQVDKLAKAWRSADWFEPPFIMHKITSPILGNILKLKGADNNRIETEFDHYLPTLYTMSDCSVAIAQVFPKSHLLSNYCDTIREAFLSYYSGYKSTAIAALIPIVESAITELIDNDLNHSMTIQSKIDHVTGIAITNALKIYYDNSWVADEFINYKLIQTVDERIYIFELIRCWLKNSFYSKTENYNGKSGLNRHIFAHGLSIVWQKPTNFHRLLGILEALIFIESWVIKDSLISMFFPSMNDEGRLLFEEAYSRTTMQMVSMKLMADRYHQKGKSFPPLTTDDGWNYRASALSEKCMTEIVRPLRDAGWFLKVGEPQKEGEYMCVDATYENEKYSVALLYSCASGNEIYKILANRVDCILYLGAPYHQGEYAYGIKTEIGPLEAWHVRNPIK